MLMDSSCHRIHDNRILVVHPVSTKSMIGFVSNFLSVTGLPCSPPFPLSSRETTPKQFSPTFRDRKHRLNGTMTLRFLRICGHCTCTRMVDQRECFGLEDPVRWFSRRWKEIWRVKKIPSWFAWQHQESHRWKGWVVTSGGCWAFTSYGGISQRGDGLCYWKMVGFKADDKSCPRQSVPAAYKRLTDTIHILPLCWHRYGNSPRLLNEAHWPLRGRSSPPRR